MQKAINFDNVAIVSDKESDYRIHFWYRNNYDALNIMKHFDLKKGLLQFFLLYIKMSEETYYQRSWETILNRTKEHENNKETLREKAKKNTENSLKKKIWRERMEET